VKLKPNDSLRYFVWVVDQRDNPVEGPFGPYQLKSAKTTARIAATAGRHDRVVTRGRDPDTFDVIRHYEHGSGQRLFPNGSLTPLDTKTLRKLSAADRAAFKVLDRYFSERMLHHGILTRAIPSGFRGDVIDADSKALVGLGSIATFSSEEIARTVIRILERKHRA
jgi:hypothetical protein